MKPAFQSLLVTICLCSFVQAEAIRQPPSLKAGDQYRLAFVTSTKTTAESADIETYNAFVQATADAAPIGDWGLTWKAIGSTETVSARENTSTDADDMSVPIFLLDGTELVPSYASLWNADVEILSRPFDVNEQGIAFNSSDPPILSAWTGTTPNGLAIATAIGRGPLGVGPNSVVGFGDIESSGWFAASNRPIDSSGRMYAISETLTAVPEPNSACHCHWLVLLFALLPIRKSRCGTQYGISLFVIWPSP